MRGYFPPHISLCDGIRTPHLTDDAHLATVHIVRISTVEIRSILRTWAGITFVTATVCQCSCMHGADLSLAFAQKANHVAIARNCHFLVMRRGNTDVPAVAQFVANAVRHEIGENRAASQGQYGIILGTRFRDIVRTYHYIVERHCGFLHKSIRRTKSRPPVPLRSTCSQPWRQRQQCTNNQTGPIGGGRSIRVHYACLNWNKHDRKWSVTGSCQLRRRPAASSQDQTHRAAGAIKPLRPSPSSLFYDLKAC